MKTWKKNAIVAGILVMVCTGIYLNWIYEDGKKVDLVSTLNQEKILDDAALVIKTEKDIPAAAANEDLNPHTIAESFAKMRMSRQESRDNAVRLLQETISYAGEGEDVSVSSKQLDEIVKHSLSEASIESLIVSKGFRDCVAYMTDDGISVAVADDDGLQDTDVALLTDVILSQTDYELPEIRIVEVN